MLVKNINNIDNRCSSLSFMQNNKKKNNKNNIIPLIAGVGVTGMIIAGVGISCKGSFNKTIVKKGLELKDNILINKKTGEKFTGQIKSNVGKIGFNRIETQSFVDGVITEKTYKNALGNELSGTFYKDGKECVSVKIGYPYLVSYNKSVAAYRYTQDKKGVEHLDCRGFTGKSVFEWARNLVKEKGWLQEAK